MSIENRKSTLLRKLLFFRKRKKPLCFISLKREIVCYKPQRGKEDKQKYRFNGHPKFVSESHGGLGLRLWHIVLLLP
jgi:hypothetical protein